MSPMCYSRFNRPPEVILQLPYDNSAEVWAVGCIASELFQVALHKEKEQLLVSKRVAFFGNSCFPCSPLPDHDESDDDVTIGEEDQLVCILRSMGNQTIKSDMIPDEEEAINCYFEQVRELAGGLEQTNLALMHPGLSSDGLDFLNNCLQFDPRQRMGIKDLLNHKFFDDIRDKNTIQQATEKIHLDVDSLEA